MEPEPVEARPLPQLVPAPVDIARFDRGADGGGEHQSAPRRCSSLWSPSSGPVSRLLFAFMRALVAGDDGGGGRITDTMLPPPDQDARARPWMVWSLTGDAPVACTVAALVSTERSPALAELRWHPSIDSPAFEHRFSV